MKLKVLPYIALFVSVVCIGFLSYRGFQWWKKQEARKELFLYFQKNSPVTKRIPADAVFYANFFDLKRIHDQFKDTSLYTVFAHWLDTGMSENEKANPLLGGMLEKTILNIVGDEFAIALMPQKNRLFDFLAVARIAPGSDFLLNLALSNAKNVEKIDTEQRIFYRIRTKDSQFPWIVIHIQENLAYASNNFVRLKEAYSAEGNGPEFLSKSAIQGIPEDTILFMQTKSPEFRGLLSGGGRNYQFVISETPQVSGRVPEIQKTSSDVVRIKTNAGSSIGQPTCTYLLQSKDSIPVSAIMLGFLTPQETSTFEQKLVARFGTESPEFFEKEGVQCVQDSSGKSNEILCKNGLSLLLAQEQFALNQAKFEKNPPAGKSAMVIQIDFQPEVIRDYQSLVQKKDWSRFRASSPFYFLSCVKKVTGSINDTNRQIDIELQ